MFKLRTKNSVDHFLEACSREERDVWAADITTAVDKLQTADGGTSTNQQQTSDGSQLHLFNLR